MNESPIKRSSTELLNKAYHLAGLDIEKRNIRNLYVTCLQEWRYLKRERGRDWNPEDPTLLMNQVAEILVLVSPKTLRDLDGMMRYKILKRSFNP